MPEDLYMDVKLCSGKRTYAGLRCRVIPIQTARCKNSQLYGAETIFCDALQLVGCPRTW